MNIKMIVTDLDGTLLRSDKTISNYTIEILKKLREEGVKIVFATARSMAYLTDYLSQIRIDGLCFSNGSAITENGIEIKRCTFEKEDQQAIISRLRNEKTVYRISAKNAVHSYYNGLSVNDSDVYYDFPHDGSELFSSISFRSTKPESVLDFLNTLSGIHYYRVTGEELTDVLPKSASKWNAIRYLSEKWHIHISEIVCFGDDFNDIEMLENCGIGVAVSNALGEVKAVSNYVCGSNDEDGAAHWLEENVFGVRTIVVIPWQAEWVTEFAKIKSELDAVLSDIIISIEHVGSTSVVGLAAKPIIDIDIVIEESTFEAVKEQLATIGYIHNGDQGVPKREAFNYTGKDHLTKHHLYVCPKDSPELHCHLALRDCLRQNPDLRDKYSKIKFEMAEKYPHDINAYINGKGDVVREIYRVWDEQKGKK